MFLLKLGQAVLVGLIAAAPTTAATVTLDFEGGLNDPGYHGNSPSGFETFGTWRESGYSVDWKAVTLDFLSPIDPQDTVFKSLSNTSDGGVGPVGFELRVSRYGTPFSLAGIKSISSYVATLLTGEFSPEPGSGFSADYFRYPTLGTNLSLFAETAEGTVAGTARTVNPISWRGGRGGWSIAGFGPSEAEFAQGVLEEFSDILTLTIELKGPEFPKLAAVDTLQEFGVSDVFLLGLSECGFNSCKVPDVGEFYFGFDDINIRNDSLFVVLDEIELEHIGTVPLPASVWALLAGLVGLGTIRLRARA